MWQQEFTWFFARFHQQSCAAIHLLYGSRMMLLVSGYSKSFRRILSLARPEHGG